MLAGLRARQSGVVYLGLLLMIAVIGVMVGAAADVWSTSRQRQREAELLWVGSQYRDAILSYYGNTPGSVKIYPARLEDLLLDNRSPAIKRHLRRLYPDPMTGKADWDLIMAPQGGIAGVRSRSTAKPLKQTGFRPRDMLLEGKNSYADWQFTILAAAPMPGGAPGAVPGAAAPPPGMPPAPTPAR